MVILLSPSKDMNGSPGSCQRSVPSTLPEYSDQAERLMGFLKKMTINEISDLMGVNNKLALLNHIRFHQWNKNHTDTNSQLSVLSYSGEAYRGLMASDFNDGDLIFAQKSLRILSGLYGILRPLDLIQPYRLEMGLPVSFSGIKNLNDFWSLRVTSSLNRAIMESTGEKVLINLASLEYSSVVNFSQLNFPVIAPTFMEEKSGGLKMITVYTKKARGMMSRFIIKNRIKNREEIKTFSDEGYYFRNQNSKNNSWLFSR